MGTLGKWLESDDAARRKYESETEKRTGEASSVTTQSVSNLQTTAGQEKRLCREWIAIYFLSLTSN